MGVNVKGGMYCLSCDRPIAGQKSTHRARGAAGIAVGLPTMAIGDGYHCPHCGGPAVSQWVVNQSRTPEQIAFNRMVMWAVFALILLLVILG